MPHTCKWVKRPASADHAAEYCGKPVRFVLRRDVDSGRKARRYLTFCPEHQAKVDAEKDEDEE